MSDLGIHRYPITTTSPQAQRFFDQGMVLAYGFNHLEALRAFRHAQSLDASCAMCFWGEAYVLGPNLNLAMDDDALPVAQRAARRAVELGRAASPKEAALTEAMLSRYADGMTRAELDARYSEAARAVARRFPGDPDTATLAAESLMLRSPWDYWADAGKTPKEHTRAALELLEGALARDPDHVAAIHYYIHLVEASDRPERAERYADRLRGAVPGAGHLVHMPSHIYLRVGRYKDALDVNRDAVRSDERYVEANPGVGGPYPLMYYPHNVHFLMSAAMFLGRTTEAVEAAEKIGRLVTAETGEAVPPVQPIMQATYFIHAHFSDPASVMALPAPSERLPFVKAAWHYARGIASARAGDPASAEREAATIEAIASRGDHSALEAAQVPARGILDVAANTVRSRAALASGDAGSAQQLAAAAVEAEEKLPYMEPPYWYMPASQGLGTALLSNGQPAAAAAAFQAALRKAPNSVWALLGLSQAHNQTGNTAQARAAAERAETLLERGQSVSLDQL